MRNEIGEIISPQQLADAPAAVARLCAERRVYRERIAALRDRTVFHVGRSAQVAADAIIEQLERPLQREPVER